ncbi:MAG: hypothetical protein ABGX60_02565 [Candidatus Thioglobus sp.]|jgi:uncharacterized membrane protein YhaH (DUF805 family)|nr:hypothetical protein [Candidatus Thioglobus autotrophicus]
MKFPKYEMNRKNFALTYLGAFPVMSVISWPLIWIPNPEITMVAMIIVACITLAIIWISILRRLENIGKSKLWFLGALIPVLNLYTLPMIWSYPPNIKENGMDKKGYFIFVLVFLIATILTLFQFVINSQE